MPETFPSLDTQKLLFWDLVPGINYPLIEVFSSFHHIHGTVYFVQMFSVEGFGVASPCAGENEARTTYTLWSRGLGLSEDVFTEAKGEG
jgi:hypothetical protein